MTRGLTRPIMRTSSGGHSVGHGSAIDISQSIGRGLGSATNRGHSLGRASATDRTHAAESNIGAGRRFLPSTFQSPITRRPRTHGAGAIQCSGVRHTQPSTSTDASHIHESLDNDDAVELDSNGDHGRSTHSWGENTSHERIILSLHGDDLFHPKTGQFLGCFVGGQKVL